VIDWGNKMASNLVVSAHPDDETLFAGGTLAMYAQKGNDVYILKSFGGRWSDGGASLVSAARRT
jgi:LmbE family N-acetylglucosaminyl deacetylase